MYDLLRICGHSAWIYELCIVVILCILNKDFSEVDVTKASWIRSKYRFIMYMYTYMLELQVMAIAKSTEKSTMI